MEITVSARHTEVSEALRQAAVEKIDRLSRFLEGMERAEVHFTEQATKRAAEKELCEVTLEGHGHHVRCKVAAPDGFAAIDAAVEKLEHQLHKLKTKLKRRTHGGRRTNGTHAAPTELSTDLLVDTLVESDGHDGAEADAGPRIVKTKQHDLKPMTPEEAMLRLDLVEHDFYFFTNAETGRAAVLYRRVDGDLGLIDQSS